MHSSSMYSLRSGPRSAMQSTGRQPRTTRRSRRCTVGNHTGRGWRILAADPVCLLRCAQYHVADHSCSAWPRDRSFAALRRRHLKSTTVDAPDARSSRRPPVQSHAGRWSRSRAPVALLQHWRLPTQPGQRHAEYELMLHQPALMTLNRRSRRERNRWGLGRSDSRA
jgi:hypothetical protein